MLTRSRTAAISALGSIVMLVLWAGAPAAEAIPVRHATKISRQPLPASARNLFISEVLKAWQITRGEGVTIAVLSTAIDRVTGLSGKIAYGPNFAPLAGAPATDGTVLASLIAGSGPTATNPFGTIGRAPGARILAEQIVDYNGGRGASKYEQFGTSQALMAKGIRYAASHGASVIVMFESAYADTSALDSAVAYALARKVVVLGTDTYFGSTPDSLSYPDSLPGVINFSGTTLRGLPGPTKPVTSPANSSILVTAPDNILFATGPGDAPYYAFGSYSTIAWVAGTVALIKSVYPQITPALVVRALALSASFHPAGGYNFKIGFGLINPQGALHEAARLLKLSSTVSPGAGIEPASGRFGASPPPVIAAVRHSRTVVGGYAGAIVVGVALLVLAGALARRRRRLLATAAPAGDAGPFDAEPALDTGRALDPEPGVDNPPAAGY